MRLDERRKLTARAIIAAFALLAFAAMPMEADAKKLHKKKWRVVITVPDSPTGNHFGTRTYLIRARKHTFPPSPLPVRKLTATRLDDGAEQETQGVWRQEGKAFSLTFELSCEPGTTCGSVILRGRFSSSTTMSGQAVIIWDTPDRENVARFETVNGAFEGTRE
jgi:hypothetical protein